MNLLKDSRSWVEQKRLVCESMSKKIILATQSNARKLLFSSLGIPFESIPANIDEKLIRDSDLAVRAEKLARAKAEKMHSLNEGIIVAADTYSEFNGKVLEKPDNIMQAKEMLHLVSGKKAVNYTGFCYIDDQSKINFSTTVITQYTLRDIFDHEIEEYVKSFPVIEWAAGFALVDPYINTFVSYINGSLTGLAYGLPTEVLIPLLRKSGFEPLPQKS